MLRVTWKQSNTDTARALETQLARAVAAEDLLRHIATQCCEVEGDVRARRDTAGEVLQAFEQVGFGFDEWRRGDEALRLGDGVDERLRKHSVAPFRSNIGTHR